MAGGGEHDRLQVHCGFAQLHFHPPRGCAVKVNMVPRKMRQPNIALGGVPHTGQGIRTSENVLHEQNSHALDVSHSQGQPVLFCNRQGSLLVGKVMLQKSKHCFAHI